MQTLGISAMEGSGGPIISWRRRLCFKTSLLDLKFLGACWQESGNGRKKRWLDLTR
jgi:hypothetical protein